MPRLILVSLFTAAFGGLSMAQAQQAPADQPFVAGQPLDMTPNARTYGGFRFAESIAYDAERDLYVAVNAGVAQDVIPNDGYISLINPDGTVHTLKWIGVNRDGLTLNHPLGSGHHQWPAVCGRHQHHPLVRHGDRRAAGRRDRRRGEPLQ